MDTSAEFWVWLIAVSVLALCIGSFLSAVIYRMPIMLERRWEDMRDDEHLSRLSLWHPSSHCPMCRTPLKWRHNIPLFSFLFLRGKCAYCHEPISKTYLSVELLTLILWLILFYIHGMTIPFIAASIASSFLIAMAFIDHHIKLLPDEITYLMLWTGLIANSFGLFATLDSAVYGAVAGYLVFFIIKNTFEWITHREGLGQGDLKLLAAIGAWVGWQALPAVMLLASISGAAVGLILMYSKGVSRHYAMAFAPHLAFACFIGLMFIEAMRDPIRFIFGIE